MDQTFASLTAAVAACRDPVEPSGDPGNLVLFVSGAVPFVDPAAPAALLHVNGDGEPVAATTLTALLSVEDVQQVLRSAARWPRRLFRRTSLEELVGAVAYYAHLDGFAPSAAEALAYCRRPAAFSKSGACGCVEYDAFSIRTSRGLSRREHHAAAFGATLTELAKNKNGWSSLHRCAVCSRLWQRRVQGFYFLVPEIAVDDWLREPYADILQWAAYEGYRRRYVARADRTERDVGCRAEGCERRAVVHSVFCLDHHRDIGIPVPPGRTFPLPP